MIQSTSQERQSRGINRTICIGIGGTGRDILMRIRRLIVDSYGDLEKLPIVSFVHIDTDKSASQISGLRTGSTYHGVDLSFKEAEKVSATMSSRSNSLKIRVTVLCARNLAKRDLFRLPDPFVRVCVEESGQTHATESSKNTLDPKWNQHYDLFLTKADSVTISVHKLDR